MRIHGKIKKETENFEWNSENEQFLIENYSKIGLKKMAEHFGVSESSIKCKARRLGVRSRTMSAERRQMLDDNLDICNSVLVSKMGFTFRQVNYHRAEYGTTVIESNDKLCVAEVARLVGKKPYQIRTAWIKVRGLKSKKNGIYRMVTFRSLFEFMRDHPELYDATECDYHFFADKKWFKEKLKQDSLKKRQKRWGEYYKVV